MQHFPTSLTDNSPQYNMDSTCNNGKQYFLKKSLDIHEPMLLDMIA